MNILRAKTAGTPGDWPIQLIQYSALAATILVSMGCVAWMLFLSHYGFDLTDESFYILWMAKPWLYDASLSQFGFIYHLLYRLVGGDIILLRQINALIFFAMAFVLGIVLFRQLLPKGHVEDASSESARKRVIAGLSFAFASVSLLGFLPFQPTPSYNTLEGQALLLAAIGTLLVKRDASWSSVAGWGLLGIAGWLSFMAKPTSAAALGAAVLAYLLLARKLELRLLLLAAGTAALLFLASALAIDGSIIGFLERYSRALELYHLLTLGLPQQNIFRLGRFGLKREDAILFIGLLGLLVPSLIWLRMRRGSRFAFALMTIVCGLCAAIMIGMIDFPGVYRSLGAKIITNKSLGTKSIIVVPLGALATYLVLAALKLAPRPTRVEGAQILIFSVFPYVYAIGTSVNYWFLGPMAGIFWVVAAILISAQGRQDQNYWDLFLPTIAVSQLITIAVASIAVNYPYRQARLPLSSQVVLPVGEAGSSLRLSRDLADYISTMRHVAQMGGFKPDTPLLDLTGQSPGVTVILGAKAIGQPWLLGGYPGSRSYVEVALERVPCEDIAGAWIVAGPSSRRALPSNLLSRYGIEVSRDYMSVGTVSARDQDTHQSYEQILYKPSRPLEEVKSACERARNRLNS